MAMYQELLVQASKSTKYATSSINVGLSHYTLFRYAHAAAFVAYGYLW